MKTFKILFVLAIAMALFNAHSLGQAKEEDKISAEEQATDSYKGRSPYFGPKKHAHYDPVESWGNPRVHVTCDKFPRVCHVKGSPGHDCCGKRCVNVKTDNFNCGMCGLKCRFPEVCCNGRCVNPLHDKKHCGGCHNKCKRGSFCYHGMCSYA